MDGQAFYSDTRDLSVTDLELLNVSIEVLLEKRGGYQLIIFHNIGTVFPCIFPPFYKIIF